MRRGGYQLQQMRNKPEVLGEALGVAEIVEGAVAPLAHLAPKMPRPHVRKQLVRTVVVLLAVLAARVPLLVLRHLRRRVQRQLRDKVAPGLRDDGATASRCLARLPSEAVPHSAMLSMLMSSPVQPCKAACNQSGTGQVVQW